MAAAEAEAAVADAVPSYRGLKRNYRCSRSLEPFYSRRAYAVSSDGSFVACAYDDKVKLVDVSSATVRATLEGDTEEVTALAISPDDKFLFSASASRLVRVWEISSSKCVRSWKGNDGVTTVMACHASGGLLATAGSDRKVLVWDVDGGFCTHFFKGHEGVITSVIFHPDPNRLLLFSGSEDETVRIWNLETKKCIAGLKKHFSAVTSLAISESDQILLSAGRDKVVNMWDLHDYSHKKTLLTYEVLETVRVINPASQLAACMHMAESTGQRKKRSGSVSLYFLTAGERGIVRIWSSESGLCLYEQQSSDVTSSNADSMTRFISVVILPSTEKLLCVTGDQQFILYNVTQASEGEIQLNLQKRLVGYNVDIIDMKFVGDEEQLLAVAALSEEVRIYDVASMSCSYVLAGHTDTVLCLDTCVLNTRVACIVTGSKDNSARLWNAVDRKCIGLASGHTGAVGAVAFSRKYKNFFVSGSRLERLCAGKAYVGLRIPDADSGTRQSIDVVLVTETEVIVVAVKNLSGFVEVGENGSWVCLNERKHRPEVCPDPVAETMRQIEVLKTYLEQRGVVLPKGSLTSRVILPNPYCRVSQPINSLPEVITHDKWEDFKPEGRSGFSSWIKDAFRGGKGDDGIYQKVRLILGTTPMWDRLELKGDKIILGEFLEFKGKQEDIQLLKSFKRSKVSQFVVQKSSLFATLGSSKLQLLYAARDYRNEGTSTSTSEWMELQVKASTELLFQPLHSKKTLRCRLSKISSLSLST